jgi:flavin-dependent dehydrogenase
MKVAIMGAGLSGLSCAIMLERYGIKPTIFENRSRVGDRFVNAEVFLSVLDRPIKDEIAYLSEKHDIYLQPVSNIRKITIFSENNKGDLRGDLGFTNLRGRIPESFENQLLKQVKSKINFKSKHTYEELLKDFTHVVMATGDAAYAAKVQDFEVDLTVTVKGATIEGDFERPSVVIWLDNSLAPQGYGYLIPYTDKEACISIGYPDNQHNSIPDTDTLWDRFYQRVCRDMKQDFRATDRFEVNAYIVGMCKYPRLGNTFFTGNCFGAIMPAFGCGQLPAILTGIYAAQDMAGEGNYLELVKPLQKSYRDSLVIRRSLEQLDNQELDKVVGSLHSDLVQRILTDRDFDPLKLASYFLRPLAKVRLL